MPSFLKLVSAIMGVFLTHQEFTGGFAGWNDTGKQKKRRSEYVGLRSSLLWDDFVVGFLHQDVGSSFSFRVLRSNIYNPRCQSYQVEIGGST